MSTSMQRYFLPEEQTKLLNIIGAVNTVEARRDHAATRALLYSGCRITEFLRITVADALAALANGYLFLPREHRKKKTVTTGGCTRVVSDDHRVFVTAPLRAALQDLLRVHEEIVRRANPHLESLHGADPLVLSRQIGKGSDGLTVRAFQLRFKAWCIQAGLPAHATPHWLRHTRAMNIMRTSSARDPRGIIQSVLGHRSIQSTSVYTRPSREDIERALTETDAATTAPRRVTLSSLRLAYDASLKAGATHD